MKGRAIGALLLAGLVLLAILPSGALDRMPDICIYRALFGVRCLGCGMTHAFACVLHGRMASAWAYNPLVIVAFPLIAGIAFRDTAVLVRTTSGALWARVRRRRRLVPGRPRAAI